MKDKIEQIVGKVESGHLEPKEAVDELLVLFGVSQQRELLQKIESVKNFEWGINPVDNENRMCELIKLL